MRKRMILIAACLFRKEENGNRFELVSMVLKQIRRPQSLGEERKWEFVNVGRFVALSSRNQKGQLTVTKTVP